MELKIGNSSLNLRTSNPKGPTPKMVSAYEKEVGGRGYSAYEIAVQEGFVGTEEEWLNSLVGPQGPQGEIGPPGQGEPGPQGPPGIQGEDGFSPTATVTKSGKVATITITDKNGTTTATVSDGEGGSGGSSEWGNITGDIADQTDLKNALDAKANTNSVPTKTSDLTNDSGFIDNTYHDNTKQDKIDSTHKISSDLVNDTNNTNKFVTATEKTTWSGKQDALVSGTNIKTINNTSLLGSGNIEIENKVPILTSPVVIWDLEEGIYKLLADCEVYGMTENENDLVTTIKMGGLLMISVKEFDVGEGHASLVDYETFPVKTYYILEDGQLVDVVNGELVDTLDYSDGTRKLYSGCLCDHTGDEFFGDPIELMNLLHASDIANNLTTNDATKALSAKQGKVLKDSLDTKGTYSKPSGGIPSSDMTSGVQTSLGKADTAIQPSNTSGLLKNDGTVDTTSYSTFSGSYNDLSNKPTIPSKTSDLTNDSGFIDNTVNNLVNYFKKVDGTLPVYFVDAEAHNTANTAFILAEKPVGLYIFYNGGASNYKVYFKARSTASTANISSLMFLMLYIKDEIPTTFVQNMSAFAFTIKNTGDIDAYNINDRNTTTTLGTSGKVFITAHSDQTITGEKTFSTLPKSSVTPTDADHLVRKGYVDAQILSKNIPSTNLNDVTTNGTYVYDNGQTVHTNSPSNEGIHILNVFNNGGDEWLVQEDYDLRWGAGAVDKYVRLKTPGGWGNWQKII